MPQILSIASTETLSITRQLVMERVGHAVTSFHGLPHIEALENIPKPDLALIGHGFRGDDKRKIALGINNLFPGLPILEMCFHSPEIPGADFILTDSPDHLISAIQDVLAGRRIRGFTS